MAFIANDLVCDDNAGTSRLYRYWSNDLLSTIVASGYFNSAYLKFNQGDTIIVAADVDGTPASNLLVVTSASQATTVTTTGISTVTQTFNANVQMGGTLAVMGTAETIYVVPSLSGAVTKIYASSDGNGAGSTATITVKQKGGTTIGTVTFASGYIAGAIASNTSPTAVALTAGTDVIEISTDGGGTGASPVRVSLLYAPS